MKTLYLVRHAKSSWKFPNLPDIDRPLNKRGQRDAPEMGRRLKEKGIVPDIMISSPADRAFTAAQMIAKKIGYPIAEIVQDHELYHAGNGTLLNTIRSIDNDRQSAMLFGHNPGFTDFANILSDFSTDNVPTTGVVALQFNVESWEDVEKGEGEFLFFDYPKKI